MLKPSGDAGRAPTAERGGTGGEGGEGENRREGAKGAAQRGMGRGIERGRLLFAPANLHVRDLWPHSLQIEHLCGRFLRERPWPWWPFDLSRCGLPWPLEEWLLLLLLFRKGLVFIGRMS
jgi:hypothetical protein